MTATARAPTPDTERYQAALEQLLELVREDGHILAAILCGSLSHDIVWEKSDIDLIFVCDDDCKTKTHSVALVADDINIHTTVTPRDDFKMSVEKAERNTFGTRFSPRPACSTPANPRRAGPGPLPPVSIGPDVVSHGVCHCIRSTT